MDLSSQKKQALLGVYNSDGLKVVFDIMEDICNQAENEFLATHPSDKEGVLSAHAILHSQRAFFQKVVAKIDLSVQELTGIKIDNRRLVDEAQLMSALPITEDIEI